MSTYVTVKGFAKKMNDNTIVTAFLQVVTANKKEPELIKNKLE